MIYIDFNREEIGNPFNARMTQINLLKNYQNTPTILDEYIISLILSSCFKTPREFLLLRKMINF